MLSGVNCVNNEQKNRENIKQKSIKIKIQAHSTALYMVLFQSSFAICVPQKVVYKNLAVIGPQRVEKQTPVYILLLSRQSYIQTSLHKKFLKKLYKTMNFDLYT